MYFGLWILVFLGALIGDRNQPCQYLVLCRSFVRLSCNGAESGIHLAGCHLLCGIACLSGNDPTDGLAVSARQHCGHER